MPPTTESSLPTVSDGSDGSGETTGTAAPQLPLELFFGFGLIGTLLVFAVILVTIAIVCFLARRKRAENEEVEVREKYTPTVPMNMVDNVEPRRPSYARVVKPQSINDDSGSPPPPLPPPPRLSDSPISQLRTKPHEIVAYDCEISKTFFPYAPPPPVHGLASNENQKFTASQNPYNIQIESLADYDEVDAMEDSPSHFSTWKSTSTKERNVRSYPNQFLNPDDTDSYYDTVESVREEVMDLTCSLQSNPINTSLSVINDGHYQSPRRKPLRLSRQSSHGSDAGINTYTEHLEPSMLYHPSISSDESESALPYGPIYASPKTLKRSQKPLEISYHNISEINDLGVSRFGSVVLAATVDLSLKDLQLGDSIDKSRSFLVAVKKLKVNAEWELRNAFHEEIKCMMKMKHANVVRLLGVCSLSSPPFSVVEYMENGDLHEFLLKQKLVSDDTMHLQEGEATPLILLYMAVQIASGMRFLASRKFIHRDLATRNCLVGREFVVKISEFGMSRSLYSAYYFRIQGQLILPIRWMAYESFYGKFSTKSDVWSFGVTLWEIYSMAENEPYPDMSDEEIINNATKGPKRSLLEKPRICPDDVFDVMKRCWVHEPSMRADFEEIYSRLFLSYISKSQQATF